LNFFLTYHGELSRKIPSTQPMHTPNVIYITSPRLEDRGGGQE